MSQGKYKTEDQIRTNRVVFVLTDRENDALKTSASKHGKAVSVYIRDVLREAGALDD